MRECEAFVEAARRVADLMEEIRVLVREEREYAERDASFPEDRESRFQEKNRMMEQAMRDMAARFHAVETCCGEREKNEAHRTVEELRGNFGETMRLVQETQTVIRRVRDETGREIREMGRTENALRAYGASRGTHNGEKGHENPGTAAH